MKKLKQYSANYSNTNHNFVIQNLGGTADINNKYYQSICVVKNILQRGKPTLMSTYLQKQIGRIQTSPEFKKHKVLISKDITIWERLIKGSSDSLYNPAQYFYQKILDNILGEECKFVKNLLLPEVLISDITQENKKEFKNQQVDFYLPQAYLVIEIDGSQHKEPNQQTLDLKRDKYLKEHEIKTVRLTTDEIRSKSFETVKKELREYISKHKILTLYKDASNGIYDLSNPIFESTIIMRYQIFILELLKYNKISFENKTWEFELFDNDENTERLLKLAISDLFIWFACLFKLQDIEFIKPKLKITKIQNLEQFSRERNVKIDFSLLKRYSDTNQRYPNIYFIRTDYIDTYKQFKSCNYTGLRAGELLGLTWDCVDFGKNTIRINKQVQRNKNFNQKSDSKTILGFKTSNRIIKIMRPLMTELTEYKKEQDILKKKLGQDYYTKLNLVFPRQDGYFTDSGTFLDAFSRIQNKLNIPHRNVHVMRHTFATRALESGMKPIVVSRLLGHASIQITMDIYGHVIPDFAEQELEKMEDFYQ